MFDPRDFGGWEAALTVLVALALFMYLISGFARG